MQDINNLSPSEIFKLVDYLNKNYTIISGWGIIKNGILDYFGEDSFILETSNYGSEELIIDCFKENEFEVEDGFYEFKAMLNYSPAQVGNYPPPNVEISAYYTVEYLEINKKATIEEYYLYTD